MSQSNPNPSEAVDGEVTFASRNLSRTLSLLKISAQAKREINKENATALQAELNDFFEFCGVKIIRLAKKYNKSDVKIKQLLSNDSNYKNTRAPSLRNALVYAKGVEVNEDREEGDRLKLTEIQKLVDDDASMQNLSKAKEKEYIDELLIFRDLKKVGARSSNIAAAVDCRTCIQKVSDELRNLSERTGMCGLAFFTRTHIHDSAMPTWVDSDDAVAFVSEVLDLDPMDFLTKFEQWACTRAKASAVQENLQTMRCDCTRLISNGLRLILNLKTVGMSYVNYEQDIVTKHKIELIGWPASIKFANPSEIGTVDNVRKLRQALKVGECKWIAQSRGQQAAYAVKLAAKIASGQVAGKKRKQRSDKGKTRGSKGGKKVASNQSGKAGRKHKERDASEDDSSDNDNTESRQPPKKKRKYGAAAKARAEKKLPPAPKSKAFIIDTDEDEDNIEDWD